MEIPHDIAASKDREPVTCPVDGIAMESMGVSPAVNRVL